MKREEEEGDLQHEIEDLRVKIGKYRQERTVLEDNLTRLRAEKAQLLLQEKLDLEWEEKNRRSTNGGKEN